MFGEFTTDPLLFAGCAAIILLLTPFQAAAEEYVFRGFFAQILGSWVRFAPVAIIVPTALFAASHAYDVAGIASVAIFGFGAAFVVWRTGGLEAGITYHALNNIAAFLFLATGMYGTTVNEQRDRLGCRRGRHGDRLDPARHRDLGGLDPLAREAKGDHAARRPHPRPGGYASSQRFRPRPRSRHSPLPVPAAPEYVRTWTGSHFWQ